MRLLFVFEFNISSEYLFNKNFMQIEFHIIIIIKNVYKCNVNDLKYNFFFYCFEKKRCIIKCKLKSNIISYMNSIGISA